MLVISFDSLKTTPNGANSHLISEVGKQMETSCPESQPGRNRPHRPVGSLPVSTSRLSSLRAPYVPCAGQRVAGRLEGGLEGGRILFTL